MIKALLLISGLFALESCSDATVSEPPETDAAQIFQSELGQSCSPGITVARQDATYPLITQPKIYLLFWGDYWNGTGSSERNIYRSIWSKLASTEAFYKQVAEYGIGTGQYLGSSVQTPSLGSTGTVNESTLQSLLMGELGTAGVPQRDANTFYVIMMPNGVSNSFGVDAHHGFTKASGRDANCNDPQDSKDSKCDCRDGACIWYAVINYDSDMNAVNKRIAHEIFDAVVDPDKGGGPNGTSVSLGHGWRDPSRGGEDEIADICNDQNSMFRGEIIQQVWSQATCMCLRAPTGILEHFALRSDGSVSYANRLPTGYWDSYTSVGGPGGNVTTIESVNVSAIDANDDNYADTHVIAVSNGTMFHARRNTNGDWSGWGNASAAMQTGQSVSRVGMGGNVGLNGDMHVCAVGTNGAIYHGIRFGSGGWSTLNDTRPFIGDPGPMKSVDCAGVNGKDLHLTALTNSGAIYHAIRFADGTWQPLIGLAGAIGGRPVDEIAIASIRGLLHVLAITDANTNSAVLYHNIRRSTGWDGWASPTSPRHYASVSAGEVSVPFVFPPVDGHPAVITGIDYSLHVVVRTSEGDILQRIRRDDTSWTDWIDVKAAAGNPGTTMGITATGTRGMTW